ncbi:MAG: hypothetical protein ACOY3K_03445 [Candidatus Omnitrophota bacterium]
MTQSFRADWERQQMIQALAYLEQRKREAVEEKLESKKADKNTGDLPKFFSLYSRNLDFDHRA